ncbi:MAG: gamma carbonic anhydrase family protein [Elusimicrobia bacterium]|nr:gamma carbonic anhydrase family protein [Elusimicrobiota bacterium]
MLRSFNGKKPSVHPSAFIHPSAEIIGDVQIKARASIWPGCVLRADTDRIIIGEGTNVQDGTVIHCDPGAPSILGKHITVGHRALIHGSRIADHVLVGMGAIVMAARIGSWSLIGAGALILDGANIAPRSLILGVPAKILRKTGPKEKTAIRNGAKNYIRRAKAHRTTSVALFG